MPILLGKIIDSSKMRDNLARKYYTYKAYPVTTGIFLQIFLGASYEGYKVGAP